VIILNRKEVMMSKNNVTLCGAVAVLLYIGGGPGCGYAQGPTVPSVEHTATGIPYLSGGVGLDERDALRAISSDYNLHVTFAQREGNFLSDVHVAIQNARGVTVLEAVPQGPWLFTKLPPEKYTVIAEIQGKAQQRVTHVPTTGHAEVYFYW
jgi:hypothetical protein